MIAWWFNLVRNYSFSLESYGIRATTIFVLLLHINILRLLTKKRFFFCSQNDHLSHNVLFGLNLAHCFDYIFRKTVTVANFRHFCLKKTQIFKIKHFLKRQKYTIRGDVRRVQRVQMHFRFLENCII